MMNLLNLVPFMVFLFLFSGCVAKRGMISDNIYSSENYPNLQIEVDPAFSHTKGRSDQTDHIFIDKEKNRWLFVDYEKIHVLENRVDYWEHPQQWIYYGINSDSLIQKGETLLLGKTWYYANSLIHEQETGECYAAKDLRRFTSDNNLFTIRFLQWYPRNDCSSMKESLTYSQS